MENLFWIVNFIIPVTMFVIGCYYVAVLADNPGTRRMGLRTRKTLKTTKAWRRAHRKAGQLLIVWGAALGVMTAAVMWLQPLKPAWLSMVVVFSQLTLFISITIISGLNRD